jgi:hypothetical protein
MAAAAAVLGLPVPAAPTLGDWLAAATRAWAAQWVAPAPPLAQALEPPVALQLVQQVLPTPPMA